MRSLAGILLAPVGLAPVTASTEAFHTAVAAAAGPAGVVETLVHDGDPEEPARLVTLFASPGPARDAPDAPLPARQGRRRSRVDEGRRAVAEARLQRPRPRAARPPAVDRGADHVRHPRDERPPAPPRPRARALRRRGRAPRRRRLLDGRAPRAPARGGADARRPLAAVSVRRPPRDGRPLPPPRDGPSAGSSSRVRSASSSAGSRRRRSSTSRGPTPSRRPGA